MNKKRSALNISRMAKVALKRTDADTSSLSVTLFVLLYLYLFCFGLLVGALALWAAPFVSAIVTVLVAWASSKTGEAAVNRLYGVGRASRSRRGQLAADLDQARYQKMQKEFDMALCTVNVILDQDPDFPDALFLKGQILQEGFDNPAAARGYFKRVMTVVPNRNEAIHRWAETYCNELAEIEDKAEAQLLSTEKQKCLS